MTEVEVSYGCVSIQSVNDVTSTLEIDFTVGAVDFSDLIRANDEFG